MSQLSDRNRFLLLLNCNFIFLVGQRNADMEIRLTELENYTVMVEDKEKVKEKITCCPTYKMSQHLWFSDSNPFIEMLSH